MKLNDLIERLEELWYEAGNVEVMIDPSAPGDNYQEIEEIRWNGQEILITAVDQKGRYQDECLDE